MAWEILAIWAIVILTVTWFFRDEQRLRSRPAPDVPTTSHIQVAAEPITLPVAAPRPRAVGLTADQQAFVKALMASRETA